MDVRPGFRKLSTKGFYRILLRAMAASNFTGRCSLLLKHL